MSPNANILVIGATSGIGAALTQRLVTSGATVHAVGRQADPLAALAMQSSAIRTYTTDVLDFPALDAAIDAASAKAPLTGLAFCPGSIDLRPLARVDAKAMLEAFTLNCVAATLAVKRAAPSLKASGVGSVVLFSTIAVAQGFGNHVIVSAAKGAVEGVMRALAAELAPEIRVNVVAPSLTRTKLAAKLTSNAAMADGIAKMHALPRLGEADDSAAIAAFLLSADSSWMTGQVLAVDGGRSTVRKP
jgi:NAD(P)-dependent dehydrogenase (short-subunit alcohol dehydrogenase family)